VPALAAPVPARSPGSDDVVVYTAHPDDEAMYGGGTMAALARSGRRVAVVVMSHGEGGRLLELGPDGKVIERRDVPEPDVARLRDREIAAAVARIGVSVAHFYPASARIDYGWTTSCTEALRHWDGAVADGVRGMLARLVADLRMRRPRAVITLDPRDDPQASHHGHHKAVGMLAELAARAAADPAIPTGGPPHVVEEVLSFAPQGTRPDVAFEVGSDARVAMLSEYPSQFREMDELARRAVEHFAVRWRASGVAVPPAGSVVGGMLAR
jgi:LmbE family N-acetylglucosaminyl deacetylase